MQSDIGREITADLGNALRHSLPLLPPINCSPSHGKNYRPCVYSRVQYCLRFAFAFCQDKKRGSVNNASTYLRRSFSVTAYQSRPQEQTFSVHRCPCSSNSVCDGTTERRKGQYCHSAHAHFVCFRHSATKAPITIGVASYVALGHVPPSTSS